MARATAGAVWPTLPYGVGGLATFVDEAAAGWVVLLDPPWTAGGLYVGGFPALGHAVGFVYGPLAGQQRLPL